MSELAARGVVTIGVDEHAKDFLVYELTPRDYRQILMGGSWPEEGASREEFARAQVDAMFFEDCSLSNLSVFTRLELCELEKLPAGALRKLRDKARELNPDFFAALDRMAGPQSKR